MKTCVFITGTNCVGKTTLAKTLIQSIGGGIAHITKQLTICNNRRLVLAGQYSEGKRYGGVDGFNQTKCLEEVVRSGLQIGEVVICEGMYMHTFGLNLQRAAFVADRQLVVFLYAPVTEIHRRLLERSGKGLTNDAVWRKQLNTAAAARKWASIGVPVLSFDTSVVSREEIAEQVTAKINELCGLPTTTK